MQETHIKLLYWTLFSLLEKNNARNTYKIVIWDTFSSYFSIEKKTMQQTHQKCYTGHFFSYFSIRKNNARNTYKIVIRDTFSLISLLEKTMQETHKKMLYGTLFLSFLYWKSPMQQTHIKLLLWDTFFSYFSIGKKHCKKHM